MKWWFTTWFVNELPILQKVIVSQPPLLLSHAEHITCNISNHDKPLPGCYNVSRWQRSHLSSERCSIVPQDTQSVRANTSILVSLTPIPTLFQPLINLFTYNRISLCKLEDSFESLTALLIETMPAWEWTQLDWNWVEPVGCVAPNMSPNVTKTALQYCGAASRGSVRMNGSTAGTDVCVTVNGTCRLLSALFP